MSKSIKMYVIKTWVNMFQTSPSNILSEIVK